MLYEDQIKVLARYNNDIGLLVEAIVQLHEKNYSLETKIGELEERLANATVGGVARTGDTGGGAVRYDGGVGRDGSLPEDGRGPA